ncbi:MAG: hypothetical protein AB7G37_07665 [Solirubrobacteraceae bacterium]
MASASDGLNLRWRRAAWIVVAVTSVLAVPGPASAASIATTPTLLDPVSPIDVAVYGRTAVWLRPTGPQTAVLVRWRAGSDAPIVTDDRLLPRPRRVALGTDSRGRRVVVVEYHGRLPRVHRIAAPGPGKVLAASRPGGSLPRAVGIRRGTTTFARTERIRGRWRDVLRRGRLASTRSKRVTTVGSARRRAHAERIVDTLVGPRDHAVFAATDRSRVGSPSPLFADAYAIRAVPRARAVTFGLPLGSSDGGTSTPSRLVSVDGHRHVAIAVSGSFGDGNGLHVVDPTRRAADRPSVRRLRTDEVTESDPTGQYAGRFGPPLLLPLPGREYIAYGGRSTIGIQAGDLFADDPTCAPGDTGACALRLLRPRGGGPRAIRGPFVGATGTGRRSSPRPDGAPLDPWRVNIGG